MPFNLQGRTFRWLPEHFEWLRPAANRLGRTLVNWRLRWRARGAAANAAPRLRALIFDLPAWWRRQPNAGQAGGPLYAQIFPPAWVPLVPARTHAPYRAHGGVLRPRSRVWRPAASVVMAPHGRLLCGWQDIVTPAGELLAELSFDNLENSYRHALDRYHSTALAPAPRHLRGDAAVISSIHSDWNYFHWMLNALPRFELLRRAGLTPARADWYILNAPPEPYQVETLTRLGVPLEKIVVGRAGEQLTADRLWATTSLQVAGQTSAWVANLLRELFLDEAPRGGLRLFVSRKDSARHPMVNEPEIEAHLAARGFQVVLPRELTVREQARLFAQAAVVVGANGAGFANLVFCPAGTKVLELFSPTWLGTYSWDVSSLRGHDYYYLIGELAAHSPDKHAYHVALSDLDRLLRLAGID